MSTPSNLQFLLEYREKLKGIGCTLKRITISPAECTQANAHFEVVTMVRVDTYNRNYQNRVLITEECIQDAALSIPDFLTSRILRGISTDET